MKRSLLSLFCCFVGMLASAQNIKFKTYTVEHGLSNNSITELANDPSGALWVATWDGLNFFDGREFLVFKHDPQNPNSLAGNYIYNLYMDDTGTLWVQSSLTSVSKQISFGVFENYYFEEEVNDFGPDRDQNLTFRVGDQRYKYSEGRFLPMSDSEQLLVPETSYEKVILKHFPDLQLKDHFRDKQGNIWFATTTTGLFILPYNEDDNGPESFHNYTVDASDPYSLRSNEVYSLHEDVFGNIWLGLKDGGLSMAHKNSRSINSISPHSKRYSELPLETIRAIHQDQRGNLLLGFYNSGVFRFDKTQGRFVELELQAAKGNSDWKRIRSINKDSHGSVWIGTYAGLIRLRENGALQYYPGRDTPYLTSGRNYDIFEDSEENCLWVACWGGLSKFSHELQRFVPFEGQEKLKDYHVRKIVKSHGSLWLATENHGVIRFDGGSIEFLSYEHGLLDNSVYSLLPDSHSGDLWIGTLGGISVYRPGIGIVRQITEKNGLFSQLVYGLLPGEDHVWVSTTKGIAAIDRANFQVTGLPPEEGWQSGEFSEGAYYKNERGTLFFAGVKGLNYFHPKALELKFDLPKIQLRASLDDSFKNSRYPNQIQANVLPVQFTANPYNQVVYRLEPLEKDWKILDPSLKIRYENLPPGAYTLLAKNHSDLSDVAVASLHIDIPMPFWKAPWFLVFSVGSVFLLFIHWRHQHNIHQRQKLQQLIDERTKTIEEQKEKLLEINASLDRKNREISEQKAQLLELHNQQKNPDFEIEKFKKFVLSQFNPPLAKIKHALELGEVVHEAVQKEISGQVNSLIRELRDWEKLSVLDHLEESKPSMTVLARLFESLTHELRAQLKTRHIVLSYDFQLEEDWVRLDVLRMKIFFHCIYRELIKFMESRSQISVESWVSGHSVYIRTRSNSNVLSGNFQQIMEGSPYIRSAQRILADLGGEMDFEVDQGVCLTICIPFVLAEHPHGSLNWEFLDMEDRVDAERYNVVILGSRFETDGVVKLLNHHQVNLIEEENPLKLISLMQQSAVDALVIYNAKISRPLLDLMQTISENPENKVALPVVYFYELMEYGLREKLIDIGVDTFIELPCSSEFINKKLYGLINNRRLYLEEKRQHALLPLSEKQLPDDRLTPNERLIRQAMRIIMEQYADPNFRVEILSSKLGISKMKCYRLFKDVLDTSPSDLIIKMRLQKAEQLLHKKQMNVSEVGFECGFNDPKYFSKLFKKHYGASPRSFV
ncbi:MAG: helix-turn-helix domain-containing protein [Lunatimonas sp.]|uniref:two-component regulator propeller domain-containing protein n=1 Tax=Lunatimonas sp. TaxID=2060141 RepID=UPI00263B3CC1|nr:two-component regulator propeller domain-containing protein [Lunatimonas sp.]MCC5939443.1 helix-turn-helix domain-containing protein [Lunatimonas sp.]